MCHPKFIFRINSEIKHFHDKEQENKFMTTSCSLPGTLKDILERQSKATITLLPIERNEQAGEAIKEERRKYQ